MIVTITWDHLIRVEAAANGRSRYTDQIVIRAGVPTPLVGLFAHIFYRYRQARWRRLARRLVSSAARPGEQTGGIFR